jgi:hypothetical protein
MNKTEEYRVREKATGRIVYRTSLTGPFTLDVTDHEYRFAVGCHFATNERACKVIGKRLGTEVVCEPTGNKREWFTA